MKDKEKASMRIGSDEVQDVTSTVRELGNTIDIWSDGVSQLMYDHGRFVGVIFPSIEHSHVDNSMTTTVYQSQCEVRSFHIHIHAGSIHFPETMRIPLYN